MTSSIVGIRGFVRSGSVLERTVVMGADFFEDAPPPGLPPVGVGHGCFIRNAIIDKNARIGDGCPPVQRGQPVAGRRRGLAHPRRGHRGAPQRGDPAGDGGVMRIAFVAAEMAPHVQVGGLGDVTRWLPRALAAGGDEVAVFLPGYDVLDPKGLAVRPVPGVGEVSLGPLGTAGLLTLGDPAPGAPTVYLVDAPQWFHAGAVYPGDEDHLRFAALAAAVPAFCRRPGLGARRGPRQRLAHRPGRAVPGARPGSPGPRCRWCSPCTTWPTRGCSRPPTCPAWAWRASPGASTRTTWPGGG